MTLMGGKELASAIKSNLAEEITHLAIKPKLAVIQVGDNEASTKYISMKQRACELVGITFEHIHLISGATAEDVSDSINTCNEDESVTGIIVQIPLPESLDSETLVDLINPEKDVDGLTTYSAGRLSRGLSGLFPATAEGIIGLLKHYDIPMNGANAVVIGRSNLVGKPIAGMLLAEGATITVCHSKTPDISIFTKNADIVVSAVGKKNLVKAEMIEPGATVVDVGIDVDFDSVSQVAGFLTPAIGGVGPMTVAMLLSNVVKAAKLQKRG